MSNKDRLAASCDKASAALQKILDLGKASPSAADQIAAAEARAKAAEDALAAAQAEHDAQLGQVADFIDQLEAGFEQYSAGLQSAPAAAASVLGAAPAPNPAPTSSGAKS